MRHRVFDLRKAIVVQVSEDRGEGAAIPFVARRLRSPRAPIEVRKYKLIHRVVDRIGSKRTSRISAAVESEVGGISLQSVLAQSLSFRLRSSR